MTDWDPATVDSDTAKGAFVQFCACAIVWLICAPVGIYARFAQRSGGDPLGEDTGADWGNEVPHNDGYTAA